MMVFFSYFCGGQRDPSDEYFDSHTIVVDWVMV